MFFFIQIKVNGDCLCLALNMGEGDQSHKIPKSSPYTIHALYSRSSDVI